MTYRKPIKWPRQYAAEIRAERDPERKQQLRDAVPEHLRGMVAWYEQHGQRQPWTTERQP